MSKSKRWLARLFLRAPEIFLKPSYCSLVARDIGLEGGDFPIRYIGPGTAKWLLAYTHTARFERLKLLAPFRRLTLERADEFFNQGSHCATPFYLDRSK